MTANTEQTTDIVIVGGGPAGSTAAILLAQQGYRVVVLEKARHPRFHIGESLLPSNLPLFERLGVAEQIRAIGMQKWAAEFVSPWHSRSQTFAFADAWNKSLPYAYQVRRSEFDEILFRRAAEQGARMIEGCRARQIDFDADSDNVRIEAMHDDGTSSVWQARFLIDASGRDTMVANQLGTKRRNKKHNSAAIYGHFRGAERHCGRNEGNISVYWFDHGWFWFIPLADGTTSVGAVVWPYYMKSRSKPVNDFLLDTIQLCAPLARRMAGATLVSDAEATGNYSYGATRAHGRRHILLGDAYAFVDPVFSSGVWLAMNSAVIGAETVDICLREPARADRALRRFDRSMRRGPKQFSWFIYRVTNPTMREIFMAPRNVLRMKEALLSVLAGDIFGSTPIWRSLAAFKGVYYASCLFNLRRTLNAVRRRRDNISDAAAPSSPA